VQSAQAAGAYVQTPDRIALANGYSLNVGQPATVSSLFGVTYIMTVLWSLSTNITFNGHLKLPSLGLILDKHGLEKASYITTRMHFRQVSQKQ
jgi:hypothetical protein